MLDLSVIRNDLKDIRYYNSRKELFDSCINKFGKFDMENKIDRYNKAVCSAPPRLFDLYYSLYYENNTQESLADKLGYSSVYISKLNSDLIKFLQKHLEEV